MKSLKPVAAASAIAASALLLASCSAGQITQTSSQVAAVDGASTASANGEVSVQDVTILLAEDGQAALKFTAVNQDRSLKPHRLVSATVDGQDVTLSPAPKEIASECSVVGTSAEEVETYPQASSDCIQYVETSVENTGFAYGGTFPVSFTFDAGTIDLEATVSAPLLKSGESERSPEEHKAEGH